MAANGVGTLQVINGRVSATKYVEIFEANLETSKVKLSLPFDYLFQKDNAHVHTASSTRAYFEYKGIVTIEHPPNSPDLNPIEHLWYGIEKKLRQNPAISTPDLSRKNQAIWVKLIISDTASLVSSMPEK